MMLVIPGNDLNHTLVDCKYGDVLKVH